ncbi:MAG: CHASE3 domain-containing protein [Rubrivivax sp.]|nr:CHASE3 domain-containing protein [Rubrivivax sp.]
MPWRLLSFKRTLTWRIAGPLAAALALLLIVTNEVGYRAAEQVTAQREAVIDARLAVGRLRHDVLRMESAQRGYMLTGRAEYRAPYDRARQEITDSIRTVSELAARDDVQRDALVQLADASERRVSELQEVLRLFDQGGPQAAMELFLTDIGREQMERIQQLVDDMLQRSEQAYAQGGERRDRVRLWSRVALVLLVLLCLGAVRAALALNHERALERAQHLRELAAERDKLEAEVQRRTHELTDLARHLQTVREDERGHLARELHDELGGLLTAAKLDVARVRKRLAGANPEAAERIDHLGRTLDAGIALKRRIIEDLRPSSLTNLGLRRTLEILCADFAQRAELPVATALEDLRLSDERALAVYRVVQEALTNVAKYAQARHVHVSLQAVDGRACVQVRDDGIGFDPSRPRPGSHGLAGMRFRMQSCGGDCAVHSAAGQGTTVQASVPL